VGKRLHRNVAALITDMEQPLGRAVGNAVEVRESLDILRGGGPADTRELTIELTAWMGVLSNVYNNLETARQRLAELLDNGAALKIFRDMVSAQGGDPRVCDAPDEILPRAKIIEKVFASQDGYVQFVDAEKVGCAVLQLGGGRVQPSDTVDFAVGIEHLAQAGDRVQKGQPVMTLLANDESRLVAARALCHDAILVASAHALPRTLVLDVLT